jgi:NAD(P)-dependent dehydrogenase (short-subunit alcohol dehydrogenase family)
VTPRNAIVVIGAGPGLGAAVARRFAREGHPIALLARSDATVQAVASSLEPAGVPTFGVTVDSADEHSLRAGVDRAVAELGVPAAVIYNAAVVQRDAPGELSVPDHLHAWAVNVVGAITAAAHTAPLMAQRGGGSYLVTGGMPRPDPAFTSLSLGKAGVRALVQLLDQQYAAAGIHVATVTVAGPVVPGTRFDPEAIAENYWRLHTQPRAEWLLEVVHE